MTTSAIRKHMTFDQWRTGAFVEVCRGTIRQTSTTGEICYIVGLTTVPSTGNLNVYVELTGASGDGDFNLLGENIGLCWGRGRTSEFNRDESCRYKMKELDSEQELDAIIASLDALDAAIVSADELAYRSSFVSRDE